MLIESHLSKSFLWLRLLLSSNNFLLEYELLKRQDNARALVRGFYFPQALSFHRSWPFPGHIVSFKGFNEQCSASLEAEWLGLEAQFLLKETHLQLTFGLFSCCYLSLKAVLKDVDRSKEGVLQRAKELEVEKLLLPDWPQLKNEKMQLLCSYGFAPLSLKNYQRFVLIAKKGDTLVHQPRQGYFLLAADDKIRRLSSFAAVRPLNKVEHYLLSTFHNAQEEELRFYPSWHEQRYHYVLPPSKGRLVYGEFSADLLGEGHALIDSGLQLC